MKLARADLTKESFLYGVPPRTTWQAFCVVRFVEGDKLSSKGTGYLVPPFPGDRLFLIWNREAATFGRQWRGHIIQALSAKCRCAAREANTDRILRQSRTDIRPWKATLNRRTQSAESRCHPRRLRCFGQRHRAGAPGVQNWEVSRKDAKRKASAGRAWLADG